MKRFTLTASAAILSVAAVTVGAYVSGPYRAVNTMFNAIQDRDYTALEETVNFPNIRQQFKAQVISMTMAEMRKSNNPYASAGAALGMTMIDGVINSMISPSGFVAMMGDTSSGDPTFEIRWTSYNRAVACNTVKDTCVLELSPTSPFSWQVNGIAPSMIKEMGEAGKNL